MTICMHILITRVRRGLLGSLRTFWENSNSPSNYGFIAHLMGFFDEKKIVLARILRKKKPQIRLNLRLLAEMVGFEPTCPVKDKTISSL